MVFEAPTLRHVTVVHSHGVHGHVGAIVAGADDPTEVHQAAMSRSASMSRADAAMNLIPKRLSACSGIGMRPCVYEADTLEARRLASSAPAAHPLSACVSRGRASNLGRAWRSVAHPATPLPPSWRSLRTLPTPPAPSPNSHREVRGLALAVLRPRYFRRRRDVTCPERRGHAACPDLEGPAKRHREPDPGGQRRQEEDGHHVMLPVE
jgi:hypothetical protein